MANSTAHIQQGKQAETIAKNYLLEKGFKLLHSNYRVGKSEIDLIMLDNKTLVFIEVKAKSGNQYGYPELMVTTTKQNFLQRGAENYIFSNNWQGNIRFDVVAIEMPKNQPFALNHFTDVF